MGVYLSEFAIYTILLCTVPISNKRNQLSVKTKTASDFDTEWMVKKLTSWLLETWLTIWISIDISYYTANGFYSCCPYTTKNPFLEPHQYVQIIFWIGIHIYIVFKKWCAICVFCMNNHQKNNVPLSYICSALYPIIQWYVGNVFILGLYPSITATCFHSLNVYGFVFVVGRIATFLLWLRQCHTCGNIVFSI